MIRKNSGVCGGRSCIGNTRIPVSTIVKLKKSGASERDILEYYKSLTKEDLVDVENYYKENQREIDSDISLNSNK